MMNKAKTLEAILHAKKGHESQMMKIDSAINGAEVNNPTALMKTECDFGKWLYAEDSNLKKVLGVMFYDKLELYHTQWHTEYAKVFEIIFKKEKKQGFFAKLTGSSSIDEMEMDKVKLYYSELKETTVELKGAIDASHRRMQALPESKFESES